MNKVQQGIIASELTYSHRAGKKAPWDEDPKE